MCLTLECNTLNISRKKAEYVTQKARIALELSPEWWFLVGTWMGLERQRAQPEGLVTGAPHRGNRCLWVDPALA